jgi:hypothetical protein
VGHIVAGSTGQGAEAHERIFHGEVVIMRARVPLGVVLLALVIGVVIAYVDSRASWDDAGVTAAALFITSAVLAAISPRAAWLIGFVVGLPVLAFNIALHGNFGAVMGIVVSLVGAGVGHLIGKTIGRRETSSST